MAPSLSIPVVSASVRRLDAADLAWASALLAQASAGHPALRYVGASPSQHYWLGRQLVGLALRHGQAYTNASGTALALWLGPGRLASWHLRLLPATARHLGWAGRQRLHRLVHTASWLRQHSLSEPHHVLLAVAVRPTARGHGQGRRLLAATLGLRRQPALPCYFSAQDPSQLPFYQKQGFVLAGHCTVADGPAGQLSNWGLIHPAAAP